MANIKVAVRIRPISEREINITGADIVVHTDGNEVSLTNLKVSASKAGDSRKRTRRYGFDYCFNSSSLDSEAHATQEKVYEKLGRSALDALFSGFNACLVAYGQSASGKTYTMMGPKNDPGLTPRLCEGLFFRIFEEEEKNGDYYETAVSYLEIYNERVRDLLKPSTNSSGLRVREHPRLGPYVQGLTRHTVSTLGSLMSYVEEGTRARKTASTSQNPTSSRSHALLTVSLTSRSENSASITAGTTTNGLEKKREHVGGSRGARLHLVDLAGSERAGNSNYGLHRLKEGANINKSLVALGNVISALAERGATGSRPGRRFIPYRDSALTWLLKDALGGNATTIMLATISPASGSYNETAHTLRFAQRAQSVVNRPVVNEDPVARVIRELRAEISRLTSLLFEKGVSGEEKSFCCCKGRQEVEELPIYLQEDKEESIPSSANFEKLDSDQFTDVGNKPSSLQGSSLNRRCNSDESLSSNRLLEENESPTPRRSGSLRSLDSSVCDETVDLAKEYDRAKFSSVSYDRVNALALVDIPTLVAVLIKPDENLQSGTVQIEEITGENLLEINSADNEISENHEELNFDNKYHPRDRLDLEKVIEPVNDQRKEEEESEESLASLAKESKERLTAKEEGTDSIVDKKLSSSLKSSKRFGSSESFESLKRSERNVLVQRSYTTLQPERSRQLNGVNPVGGKGKRTWSPRGSTWASPRKVDSGEKDVSVKKINSDIERNQDVKQQKSARNPFRKQDSDSPKRKISREFSKEETTTGPTPKLVRKGSVTSEITSRTQTPIQRTNRRAEIVAAVTERLYSTKKAPEVTEATGNSPVGEFRSPESTEVKLANTTRMKLQEISRKMLAKRRKTCVDTQTDAASTVRVKDTASITDSTEIEKKDAAIMTEIHENYCGEIVNGDSKGFPVTRVKEIATLTEKFERTVRCKDIGILTEDYEITDEAEEIIEIDSNAQREKLSSVETSTNTIPGSLQQNKCSASQTLQEDIILTNCKKTQNGCSGRPNVQECCYQVPVSGVDRNVICITLPDMLSITIESTNNLESKIAVTETTGTSTSDEKVTYKLKDGETQTENYEKSTTTDQSSMKFNYIMLKDLSTTVTTRSASCQSDGKTFRIENIFKDPKSAGKIIDRTASSDLLPDLTDNEHVLPKSSLKLTNSVGTSFTPETMERSTEIDGVNLFEYKTNGKPWRELPNFKFTDPTLKRSCRATGIARQVSVHSEIPSLPLPVSWPVPSPVQIKNNGFQFRTQSLEKEESSSIGRQTVAKIEAEELKSPLLVARLISNSSLDMDSSFSDDSLDPDELSPKPESKSAAGLRPDDSLCPPDVVAHTKKDVYESRVEEDFADEVVEFPRSSVSSDTDTSRVHDYESLVLGRKSFIPVCQDSGESSRMETPESEEGRNQSKKKVSFSNSKQPADRPQANNARKPKPIIKNKLNTFAGRAPGDGLFEDHHLHGENGDSRSNCCMKSTKLNASTPLDCSTSENSFRDDVSSISESSETIRSGILYNSDEDSDTHLIRRKREDSEMKRVRFTTLLFNGERAGELSGTSDSECCENNGVNSDEENYCCEIKGCDLPHRVFASYINEATAFVHNMNTMNDYVNASRLFLQEQKDPEEDYIEYKGCRISLRDDTDEYLKPEDFNVPEDSYKNCLNGIAKLENCIERAVRHDKFLLDKYGICLESATTSYSLVDSGNDSSRLKNAEVEFAESGKNPRFQNPGEFSSNDEELVDEHNPPEAGDPADSENAIFEHLMDSANPRRRSTTCGKPYFRRSTRMSDLSGKNPTSYSRLRKKYWDIENHRGTESQFEDLKWYTASSDHGSLQSSPEVIKETTDLKIPQCFLMVPERITDNEKTTSFGKEYRNNDVGAGSSSSEAAVGTSSESIDTVASVRNKFRYPGSPRAKLLQLVSERRQIVNRSRNGSPI